MRDRIAALACPVPQMSLVRGWEVGASPLSSLEGGVSQPPPALQGSTMLVWGLWGHVGLFGVTQGREMKKYRGEGYMISESWGAGVRITPRHPTNPTLA